MCCKQSSVHRVCIHVHYVIHVDVVDPSASRSQVFVGRLIVCRRRAGEEILYLCLYERCVVFGGVDDLVVLAQITVRK